MSSATPPSTSARLQDFCSEIEEGIIEGRSTPTLELMVQSGISFDDEGVMEVFYVDYVTRSDLGLAVDSTPWFQAFPHLTDRMIRIGKLHELLEEPKGHSEEQVRPFFDKQPLLESEAGTTVRILGQYALKECIAKGSFAEVYRAYQLGLGRTVAVKVIQNSETDSPERFRLREEGNSIACLQHPNIVQVYEVSTDDDCEFLSMEFVSGGNLQQQMQNRRSVREIATLVSKLAGGVHFAHEHGIVHCDLKPANILLDEEGNPKIADFGLAMRLQDRVAQGIATFSGTPFYMAPEQVLGDRERIGPKTDIYALGVILYEMLTRRLPIHSTDGRDLLHRIVHQKPRFPSTIDRSLPRDLETICMKCLEKKENDRYDSAIELREDLLRFLEFRPIHARRSHLWERGLLFLRRNPRNVLIGILLSLLCVSFALATQWNHRRIESMMKLAEESNRKSTYEMSRAIEAEKAFQNSLVRAREMAGLWSDVGDLLGEAPGMSNVGREALENAVAYYEEFFERSGGDPRANLDAARSLLRLSVLYEQLGMWAPAEQRLKVAFTYLRELPLDPEIECELANCYVHRGRVSERFERWGEAEGSYRIAAEKLEQLVIEFPNNAHYGMRLAHAQTCWSHLLQDRQRWSESWGLLQSALAQQVHCLSLQAGLRCSLSLKGRGQLTPDQEFTSELLDASRELRMQVGKPNERVSRILESEHYLEEMASSFDALGFSLQGMEQFDLAENSYREAFAMHSIEESLKVSEVWRNQLIARNLRHLGMLLMARTRRKEALEVIEMAIDRMKELVHLCPDRVDYEIDLAQLLCDAARIIRLNSDPLRAIGIVKEAIAMQEVLVANHPGSQRLKSDLGLSLGTLGVSCHSIEMETEALEAYERAILIDASLAGTSNNYAWLLCNAQNESLRDYERALKLSERAVALKPSEAHVGTYALALIRNGNLPQALSTIQPIESRLSTPNDLFVAALIYAKNGDVERANPLWERGKELRGQSRYPADVKKFQNEVEEAICLQKLRLEDPEETSLPVEVNALIPTRSN